MTRPKPWQVSQAPSGELNEKSARLGRLAARARSGCRRSPRRSAAAIAALRRTPPPCPAPSANAARSASTIEPLAVVSAQPIDQIGSDRSGRPRSGSAIRRRRLLPSRNSAGGLLSSSSSRCARRRGRPAPTPRRAAGAAAAVCTDRPPPAPCRAPPAAPQSGQCDLADAREQEPQIVGDLGDRADGGARVA